MKRTLISATVLALLITAALSNPASAQTPAGYEVVDGAFINGSGIGPAQSGQTVSACAALCDREARCLSFEFRASGGWCSLNVANRSTRANILSRSAAYRYFEKAPQAPEPPPEEELYVYQNCTQAGRCTLGVGDANYARPSNARFREGWRRLAGPFADHPAAWRRACEEHAPPHKEAPDITSGEIDCAALGAGSSEPTMTNGVPAGYVLVDGAFINGSGIGQAQSGQTVASCAVACTRERRCLSFEFRESGGWCSLNVANRATRASILTRAAGYRYFEKQTAGR